MGRTKLSLFPKETNSRFLHLLAISQSLRMFFLFKHVMQIFRIWTYLVTLHKYTLVPLNNSLLEPVQEIQMPRVGIAYAWTHYTVPDRSDWDNLYTGKCVDTINGTNTPKISMTLNPSWSIQHARRVSRPDRHLHALTCCVAWYFTF